MFYLLLFSELFFAGHPDDSCQLWPRVRPNFQGEARPVGTNSAVGARLDGIVYHQVVLLFSAHFFFFLIRMDN
jgi:hypothetical protein